MKKILNALEVFAKAMVQPLMYLSVAGMILAIGSLLTNTTVTGLLPFLAWGPIQVVGKLMYETMMILINNLGLLFVIGIPAALAKRDKQQAGLIGFMSYMIYLKTSNLMLVQTGALAEPSAMLGLFGTVVGMIQMFLGVMEVGVGDVNQLAGGIGKALVCAATGMIVAVPALMFHRWFRGRVDTYIVEMEQEAIALMDALDPRTRRAAVAATPSAAPAADPVPVQG